MLDLASAWRAVATRRALTAVVVATTAVGVGAHTIVFSITKAVVLNPLPYAHPERLVTITIAGRDPSLATFGAATVRDWAARSRSFERFAMWNDGAARFRFGDRVEMIRGMRVSASYFETFGVRMYLGRNFLPEEDTPAGYDTLILSYRVWQERFGGDPTVVGRSVPGVDSRYRVVGVLPPEFHPLHMSNPGEFPRVFLPTGFGVSPLICRTCFQARVIGLLRPGASPRQARAELTAVDAALAREHPDVRIGPDVIDVVGLRDGLLGRFGVALSVCEAAASVFLLLACVNVAALLLTDGDRRARELAMRTALGAARGRLVRQLLVEALLRAAIGGAAGIGAAWAAIRVIAGTGAAEIPRLQEVSPDRFTLMAGVAAIAATGFAFGLLPALRASRVDLNTVIKGADTSTEPPAARRAMRTLLAAQLALAFVLVLTVALLGRSYLRLIRIDPGFEAANLLTVSLLPDGPGYGSPLRHLAYFDAVVDRVRRAPFVAEVSYASTLPLSHPNAQRLFIREHGVTQEADAPIVDKYLVSPTYFDAMRIPLVRGRPFSAADSRDAAAVAIVSETCARTLFPNDDPIGRHVQLGTRDDAPWATIVGIVGDVRQYGLDVEPAPAAYMPFAQALNMQGWASLIVRSSGGADAAERTVRAAMADVDPQQPVFHLQPMDAFVSKSIVQRTFTLLLVAAFGVLALALALLGVFAVASYVVGARRRELAIRVALGASGRTVAALIGGEVMLLAATGLGAGFVIFLLIARTISTLLFETPALDPLPIAATAAALAVAAAAAAAAPLRRALGVDPAAALRSI